MRFVSSSRAPYAALPAAALCLCLSAACRSKGPGTASSNEPASPAKPAAAAADVVERGRYLGTVLGCGDCHTPMVLGPNGPEPDMARMLSGHPEGLVMPPAPPVDGPWAWHGSATNTAYAGPWGVSFATNLTPDEDTGIGAWTEEIFINAIRTGKHWGQSRPILPPMPWQTFAKLTDEDLRALYAWLRTVPPIKNQALDAILAPPPAAP